MCENVLRHSSLHIVLTLTPFDTMDEAIKLANDTEYSLSAGLWTSNLHEAMTYAPQIRSASVHVNGATVYVEISVGNVSRQTIRSLQKSINTDLLLQGWSRWS